MADKVRVITTWLQGCSGCHIAFLDMHEDLLDVLELIEIKHSPLVDAKDIPEADLAIIEGSVGNDENEHVLKAFREKADKVLAFGTCACFGGVPGLRNLFPLEDVLQRGYVDTESTVDGHVPCSADIPALKPTVSALHQVVDVDYFLPGCPPVSSTIKATLVALIEGREPELKTRNLCEECERTKERMLIPRRDFVTDAVTTVPELEVIDTEKCFLEQGVLCMGPATKEGCHGRCMEANMPCRGCMGPPPNAEEQGAKIINAISSILPAGGLMFDEDIVGVGYRYSLPVSVYPHRAEKGRKPE